MRNKWLKISVIFGMLIAILLFSNENNKNSDFFSSKNTKKRELNARNGNSVFAKKSIMNGPKNNANNVTNSLQNAGLNNSDDSTLKKIVELKSSNKDGSSASFSLPDFSIEEIKKNDGSYSQIKSDKLHEYNVFNKPVLPIHKEIFLIPQNTDLSLDFSVKSVSAQKIEKLVIGTGDYLRKQKAPEVNYEFYQQSTGIYPEKIVEIEDIIEFRGHKMVVVAIYPFAYDVEKKELIIRKQIDFSISTPNATRILTEPELYADFATILNDTAINYSVAVNEYEKQTRTAVTTTENGKLLLVFPEKFDVMNPFIETDLNEFINWKSSIGWNVSKLKISLGSNVNTIKSLIAERIEQNKITHIILIGDAEHIPSPIFQGNNSTFKKNDTFNLSTYNDDKHAYSDSYYAGVNAVNNDYTADVILSRISVKNMDDLKKQLTVAIKYEKGDFLKNGNTWQDWHMKTTLLASSEFRSYLNCEYKGVQDFAHLENQKNKFKKSMNCEFADFTTNYEPNANLQNLINSFNSGTGLFYYLGHGAYNGFSTTGFNVSHLSAIKNQCPIFSMQPVCVTGGFFWSDTENDSCMSEVQMTSGKFVGALAATSNTYWYPPMNLIEEFTNSLISDNKNTIGAHILYSINKAATWSATKESKYDASYFAAQMVSFGDCTLGFRTKKMKTPQYDFLQKMIPGRDNSLENKGDNCFAPVVIDINYDGTKITTINTESTNITISVPEINGSFSGQLWSRNSFPQKIAVITSEETFYINKSTFSEGDILLNVQLYYPGINHEILNDSRFIVQNGEIIYVGNNLRNDITSQLFMLKLSYIDFNGETRTQRIMFSRPNQNKLFKYNLNAGWNFIGSPVNTQTTTTIFPETRVKNNDSFYWQNLKYNYKSQKISTLNAESAFWVYANSSGESSEFSGNYSELPRSTFSSGWDTFSPSSIVPYLQQAECIWEWDSTAQTYREVERNESLNPMTAYWIFCTK